MIVQIKFIHHVWKQTFIRKVRLKFIRKKKEKPMKNSDVIQSMITYILISLNEDKFFFSSNLWCLFQPMVSAFNDYSLS